MIFRNNNPKGRSSVVYPIKTGSIPITGKFMFADGNTILFDLETVKSKSIILSMESNIDGQEKQYIYIIDAQET